MTILYVLAALLLLGVMVTVHEAGHFFAARLCGIPVKQFAIGFGPKLVQWKSKKHETAFSLRLIPAGGFCMFYGEDGSEDFKADDPRNLNNFGVLKRMLTIVMGPIMNFVLAFVVAFGFYMIDGVPTLLGYGRPVLTEVQEGGAAAESGLKAGDYIESVNGQSAQGIDENGQWTLSELLDGYKTNGAPLQITVTRGEETLTLPITPRANEDGKMLIGVSMSAEVLSEAKHYPVWTTLGYSWDMCVQQGMLIINSLRGLLSSGEGFDQMAGPVGVVSLITEQTKAYGLSAYLSLLIFISVNLGLMNLLPIPGLDGSRLIFLIVEGIRKKPIDSKIEGYIHMSGALLFILLFIVLTWQDIVRIFS